MIRARRTILLLAVVMGQLLANQQALALANCHHAGVGAIHAGVGAIHAGVGAIHAGVGAIHAGEAAGSAADGHAAHGADAAGLHHCRHCHCTDGTSCGQLAALLTEHRLASPLARPRSNHPSPHVPPTTLAHRWEPLRPPNPEA